MLLLFIGGVISMPLTIDPSLKIILADVDVKWHVDFVRFVQTGKADPPFLELLDEDEALQQAVERAIFADEGDIRERYQNLIETDASGNEEQQEYGNVLRDAKLATAALEEATKIAASRAWPDGRVNTALGDALRASRSAVDTLVAAGGGRPS
jgi:hypothetical protein